MSICVCIHHQWERPRYHYLPSVYVLEKVPVPLLISMCVLYIPSLSGKTHLRIVYPLSDGRALVLGHYSCPCVYHTYISPLLQKGPVLCHYSHPCVYCISPLLRKASHPVSLIVSMCVYILPSCRKGPVLVLMCMCVCIFDFFPFLSYLPAGLKEDLLAFRVSFVNNESLFFRAAKPNQRNAWIEMLEKVR